MREYWDVGEFFPFPNLGKTSTAKVMQALIKLQGKLHSSCFFGSGDMSDHLRTGVYRISLPVGKRAQFEEMTGYALSEPREIHVNT